MVQLPRSRPASEYVSPQYVADVPIYDTPLPDIPMNNTTGRIKHNKDYNTLSSDASEYNRKYFVLDKEFLNAKNIMSNSVC